MNKLYIAFLVAGVALGVAGTMALHVSKPGPDAGDWLSFSGAVVGVTFTILGTLWLEDYRAKRGEREGAKIVRTSVEEIRTKLAAAVRVRGDEAILEFRLEQINRENELIRSFEKYVYARHYVPKQNIEGWQASEDLATRIIKEKTIVENEVRLIDQSGDNENVVAVNLNKLYEVSSRLNPYLDALLKIIPEG
jgi:hypothetical protein